MNSVTKKWMFMKISSVILIPLMLWFILNLVSIYDKDYIENEKLKYVATKLLYLFAIIIPILTLLLLYRLSL